MPGVECIGLEPSSGRHRETSSEEPVAELRAETSSEEPVAELRAETSSEEPVAELRAEASPEEPVAELRAEASPEEPDSGCPGESPEPQGPLCACTEGELPFDGAAQVMLEASPTGMLLFDGSGALRWGNQAAGRLLGEPVQALLGLHFDDESWASVDASGEMRPRQELPVAQVLATGNPVREEFHHVRLRSGEVRVLCLSADPIRHASAATPCVLLTLRDDTEGAREREALERLRRLRETERLLSELSEHIHEVFWSRTRDKVLYINAAYERVFGRSRASLLEDGSSWLDAVHPEDRERVETSATTKIAGQGLFDEEFRVVLPDGTIRWVHSRSYPVEGSDGRSIGSAIDITREKEARLALEQQARTDILTGLWNRGHFEARLREAFAHWQRYDVPAVLFLLDIDNFKSVNDDHGHDIGDRVLIEVARRLQKGVRVTDMVGRWGGEEFVVLLTHTDLQSALRKAEGLRAMIAMDPVEAVGSVTASFGVSTFHADDQDIRAVVRRADGAMYAAKAAGKNCVHVADASFDEVWGEAETVPTARRFPSLES